MRENSYSAGGEKNFGREKECYYLVVAISDDLSDISYYVRYYYYRFASDGHLGRTGNLHLLKKNQKESCGRVGSH